MILLMGSSRDDVLYFETIIKNKVNCHPLFNRFPMIQGTIFNQNVMLVYGVYSSYVTGALVESIIKEYSPLLVISVGRCKAISNDLKTGDIVISDSLIAMDVEQNEFKNVKVGQIPGFDQEYRTNLDIMHIIDRCFDKFLINNVRNAAFMCSNRIFSKKSDLDRYFNDELLFGHKKNIVLDCESFGILVPCLLNNIPFVAIKAVDSLIGVKSDINSLVKTLETYSAIGKAVTSFIGEVGRRDLVE